MIVHEATSPCRKGVSLLAEAVLCLVLALALPGCARSNPPTKAVPAASPWEVTEWSPGDLWDFDTGSRLEVGADSLGRADVEVMQDVIEGLWVAPTNHARLTVGGARRRRVVLVPGAGFLVVSNERARFRVEVLEVQPLRSGAKALEARVRLRRQAADSPR